LGLKGTNCAQRRKCHVYIRSTHVEKINTNRISLTKRPDAITLGPNDKLKLTFQVAEQGTDNGVQPHQTFLRFFDSTTGEEGIQPVKTTPSGKAKFELVRSFITYAAWFFANSWWLRSSQQQKLQNMAKPPSSLPPSGSAPLHVSLILGSFVHSPATLDLFDLYIPPSAPAPVHPEEALYHPRPEIVHTFRPDPKLPPRPISAFFAGLVLAPWAVLFVLVRLLPFSLHATPFLVVADNSHCALLISGVLCVQAFHTSSHLAYSLSYSPLASSRVSYFGTGSSFALERSSCTARVRLHLPYS